MSANRNYIPSTDFFSLPGASLKSIPAVVEKDFGALNRDLWLQEKE